MTDLFTNKPRLKVGQGNGNFLADLAMHVSDHEMRRRWAAGDYENIHRPSVPHWRRMAGRSEGNG